MGFSQQQLNAFSGYKPPTFNLPNFQAALPAQAVASQVAPVAAANTAQFPAVSDSSVMQTTEGVVDNPYLPDFDAIRNIASQAHATAYQGMPIKGIGDNFYSPGGAGVSSARPMYGQQGMQGPDQTQTYLDMINKGAAQLDPYRQAGLQGLEQLQSGGFGQDQFQYGGDAAQFQYGGETPGFNYESNIPGMQYSGQAVSDIGYQGQQPGQFQYGGSPESRSIQSFMGDITQDPGYQFRLEEGQKAIDRASAASGRFGGGRTAKELMRFGQGLASQEYGAAYGRAGQERDAQMQAEQQQYGRGLTGYGLEAAREQQGYGRAVTGAEFARAGEQDQYGRALTDVGLDRDAEQQMYGRALIGDERALGLERQAYGRAVGDFERELGAEQLQYGRAVGEYGMEDQRLDQQYGRAQDLAGIGERAATATGGMYSGLGSQLLGQSFQEQQQQKILAQQRSQQASADQSGMFSTIGGLVGGGLGLFLGGPAGGMAGYALGSGAGSLAGS